MIIENTSASANMQGRFLTCIDTQALPLVHDMIGTIKFTDENDADEGTYGEIQAFIEDETDLTDKRCIPIQTV